MFRVAIHHMISSQDLFYHDWGFYCPIHETFGTHRNYIFLLESPNKNIYYLNPNDKVTATITIIVTNDCINALCDFAKGLINMYE